MSESPGQPDHPPARPAGERRLVPVGVSACLLGQEVRWDGGHKRYRYLTDVLSRHLELRPFCPEAEIGLGVPRQPIRLVGGADGHRVLGVRDRSVDVTEALDDYSARALERCRDLRGFVLKRGSPSCAMERAKVYDATSGMPVASSPGRFAANLMAALPLLPCEEEGRLNDPILRENFLERVFTYDRWHLQMADGVTPRKLVEFHTRHKMLVLAHSELYYRRLGRMVADAGRGDVDALADRYLAELMAALTLRATPKRHANVLQHLAGYLKRAIDGDDRAELGALVDDYRRGEIPLVVPLTLLRHHLRRHRDAYVEAQVYLEPHPESLRLRNVI
ncbi:MAG: DUF1722 domain-containing protein [Ectothiorhodospiraceae bacterium]|nr:DUF1722 domain-containing protein [Ectothiorhodospiraceae bacterium]